MAQAVKLREAGAGDRFTAQLAGRTYLVAFTPLPRRFGKDWSIGVIADIGEEDRHVSPLAADPAPFPGCDEEFTRRAEALTPENVLAELKFQPHDLLRVISRTTGGKDYAQLRGSLDRLKSTIITTNIRVPRGNFDRRRDLGENSDLGLTLPEAKQWFACSERSSPRKHEIMQFCVRSVRLAVEDATSKIGSIMRSRRCSARWRCGSRGFAVSAVVTTRLASAGHRIAGRHQSWTSCEHIFRR